jgi:hypothetical protein
MELIGQDDISPFLLVLSVVFFFLNLLDDLDGFRMVDFDLLDETDVLVLRNQGVDIETQNSQQIWNDHDLQELLEFVHRFIFLKERP